MSAFLVLSPDGCGVWSHPVNKDLHPVLVGTQPLKPGEVLQSSALHHHVVGEKAHLRPGGQIDGQEDMYEKLVESSKYESCSKKEIEYGNVCLQLSCLTSFQ